ncbi:aldo/keto reductase [Dethiobacter alkaliphilus]|uniref:aldo/keto reductase n=1 Tax=Dethiobacter alkaliphilus TaxID=427926 RepID=UPI0022268B32|nr:aldo/keto reductase [Dethiobacter alkaliphilus]MCW3490160.1 aldo/keto reductase [Dethiobacter alkaliphilus]
MEYGKLGNTGIEVSKIAFGTLTMGPLQRDIAVSEGAPLIREALEKGITFLDGAQAYGTYGHIREALKGFGGNVVIASKSAAKSYTEMADAVEEARKELDRDIIDVFLMHAVQREDDLATRQEGAWQCLQEMKAKGMVKAIGLSTHNLDIVEQAAEWPEMDVIHPIFNKLHFGLINPDNKDPEVVIRKAYEKGIGMYAMKPLAGGHLYQDATAALRYAFDFPYIHAVAVGMVKKEELSVNLKIYNGIDVTKEELEAAASNKRMYVVKFCKGCGNCVESCEQGAISMVDEKAYIEHSNCILCGYCRKSCPHSMIRII